jgi:hypothetical protein
MTRFAWLLIALAFAGCSEHPGPGPGPIEPGKPCEKPADCGCWECFCEGYETPGGAQLCVGGKCPTGEGACESVCAIVSAKVTQAKSVDACPAVP